MGGSEHYRDTDPESHESGVGSFGGFAVRGDVIEKAVGKGKVVLGGVRLVG